MIATSWRMTRSINLAATLFACGVRVKPSVAYHAKSGQTFTEFFLMGDGRLPAAAIPYEDPHRIRERFNLYHGPNEAWRMEAGMIRKRLEDRTLEEADPEHPAVDVMRILEARECLLTFMKRGERFRLEIHPTKPRARYVPGSEPLAAKFRGGPAKLAEAVTWTTRDLGLAACMGRIGCPVIDITGPHGAREFVLPRYGYTLPGRFGPEDALALAQAAELQPDPAKPVLGGALLQQCPEHPIVWGLAGLEARLQLQRAIESRDSSARQVFLHFDRSSSWRKKRRSALVEERAPNGVMDQAMRHLKKA